MSSLAEQASTESAQAQGKQCQWVIDHTDPATETESALDVQFGGSHYKDLGQFQPWEVAAHWLTPEEMKGAMKLTVMSYLARESKKGGREDIKKAMHTIQLYLELTENVEEA